MIKEAIEKLQCLVEAAETAKPLDMADYRDRYFVIGGDVRAIEPPLPCRTVYSLEDLIAYGARLLESEKITAVEVYYSATSVVLLPDASDARTQVVLQLPWSLRWQKLQALAATPTPLDQRSFVRLLYADLYLDSALITPWRKMDFHAVSAVSGEVARGRDRMGRDVTSQAVGADQLPEILPVSVPIYDVCGERDNYVLECRVDIDAATQRITLLPDSLAMHEMQEHHLEAIGNRLKAGLDGVGVYFGATK